MILLIGFNKCATLTFHDLFEGSGIASAHWTDAQERPLAQVMQTNLALGLLPFEGVDAQAFSDISFASKAVVIEGVRGFRTLHAAYPDAHFILNTRPVEAWIASRRAHAGGSYLARSAAASGLAPDRVAQAWRAMHARHEAEVTAHFAGHPRFLRFDISTDDPARIAAFLSPDHAIDLAFWGHRNARNPRPGPSGRAPA